MWLNIQHIVSTPPALRVTLLLAILTKMSQQLLLQLRQMMNEHLPIIDQQFNWKSYLGEQEGV